MEVIRSDLLHCQAIDVQVARLLKLSRKFEFLTRTITLTLWEAISTMTHTASFMSHGRWSDVNQLTIRGFDNDLSASVRRLAKREGISLH